LVMSEHVKVVAIWRGTEAVPWQFALAAGEVLSIGRSADCDVQAEIRGVSGRHVELRVVEAAGATEGSLELHVKDTSTNGTGLSSSSTEPWAALRGESRKLGPATQLLVPLNRKAKELSVVLTVRVLGDGLPDAYDDRGKTGRWRYNAKLGEGALGIVFRASDVSGKLQGDVAVKVSKITKAAKPGAKLRHAYILHREAQWSLERLHNQKSRWYKADRAAHFAKYLEDHTGRWAAPELDFEAERTVFEAADFRWDGFRPSPPAPACPYVVMELVPGRTLHSCLGLGHDKAMDPPLTTQEKKMLAKQLAEAVEYMSSFGLIHRDFRTTNLLLVGRGSAGRIRVIDLGHTIAAEHEQVKNRSAVVRCSWKESKQKRFDWAPMEVKSEKDSGVNFSFPVHAFDVFSLTVLLLQLETGSLQAARAAALRLTEGNGDTSRRVGALGLDEELLRRMLGPAATRPRPLEVLMAVEEMLHPKQASTSSKLAGGERGRSRSRGRTQDTNRGRAPGQVSAEAEVCLDDGYATPVDSAVAYGSATEQSGSATV